MKINRKQLRRMILKEFKKMGGGDFNIDDINFPGGGYPQEPQERGEGGSNKLHQLIRIDSGKDYYDPSNYIAIPIKTGVGSLYSNMAEEYDVLDPNTKEELYDIMPVNLKDHPEYGILMQIKEGYRQITNGFIGKLEQEGITVGRFSSYEYFTVYHPSYVNDPAEVEKKFELYQKVTGYSVEQALLIDYEAVMHAASNLHG